MSDKNPDTHLDPSAVLAMVGEGYYSANTAGARHVITSALPMVEAALKAAPYTERLRLADFGAADGGTSQPMWAQLLTALRHSGDTRQIEMLYTDLASNDFSALFRLMQGFTGSDALAYQVRLDDIFVHGCGTGFHRQLMADNSLTLGFSATAMHYVSAKPCEIEDHVHMVGGSAAEQAAFRAQAARDWDSILLARAKELIPGGRFICYNFGIDDAGRFLGHTGGVHMFDMFAKHWHALLDDGVISRAEYRRATFAQHYRTMAEFLAPFEDPESPVAKAGLRVRHASSMLTPCPYRAAYDAGHDSGGGDSGGGAMSAAEFARSYIPTLRSWSETVFATALDGRPADEAAAIVDAFYQAYEDDVAASPDGHAMDYIHLILDIEKTALGSPA